MNENKPLPAWLKLIIKQQKMYIQFLKGNTHNKGGELLNAQKFLKWLQDQFKR